jgi:Ca-activated chloride channel family protein
VKSHHHQVRVENAAEDTRLIRLDGNAVPADRDFELTWRPAASQAPAVGLFRERVGDADYLLAFVTPPALAQEKREEQRPREIIFVIDNSGSMGGTSIAQAKASLIYALDRLKPTDRFNVIRFDDSMDVLFPDTVSGDAQNVARAKGFVLALEARGGTEMLAPLKAALTDARAADAGFLRQVVFITDGAVGNEQQLFDALTVMRGRSRVFMVGIGSAPNSFLMTRAAELGRGAFTHIGSAEQVETRMRALFEKLESPVVTNLQASLSGTRADMTPAMLPDIYRGEPLVLAARVDALAGTLEVKGMVGDQPWIVRLPIADAAEGRGLSKVWARRKIADAEVLRTLRRLGMDEADKQILALALEHGLVTRLTSLVAVDKTPSRPEGARLTRAELPLNLPAGWEFEKVFGRDRAPLPPSDATETRRADADDMLRLAAAGAVAQTAKPVPMMKALGGVQLPKTATDAELRMLFGLLFLAVSLLLLALRRMMRTEAHA